MKNDYAAVGKNYPAQRAFRHKWLEGDIGGLEKTLSYTTTCTQSSERVGSFETPLSMLALEGGGVSGLRSTQTWMWRCIQMGGRFMSYDNGKEMMNFVYVKTGFREVFEECWRVHEVMKQGKPAIGGQSSAAASPEVTPRAAAEADDEKPKRSLTRGRSDASAASSASGNRRRFGGGLKGRRVVTNAEQLAQKEKGKHMREALDQVKKSKVSYNQTLGGWGSTNKLIEEDSKWDHAKGDKETLKAVSAAKRIEDIVMKDTFYSTWLANDAASLRKHYKDAEFVGIVAKKLDKLDKGVKELDEHLTTVKAMHNARPETQPLKAEPKKKVPKKKRW